MTKTFHSAMDRTDWADVNASALRAREGLRAALTYVDAVCTRVVSAGIGMGISPWYPVRTGIPLCAAYSNRCDSTTTRGSS